jgi:hypothetical protein
MVGERHRLAGDVSAHDVQSSGDLGILPGSLNPTLVGELPDIADTRAGPGPFLDQNLMSS